MTIKAAMSAHLGCENVRELENNYRYQPAPGIRAIYATDDYRYTAGMKRPHEGQWEMDPDQFYAIQADTIIWRKPV